MRDCIFGNSVLPKSIRAAGEDQSGPSKLGQPGPQNAAAESRSRIAAGTHYQPPGASPGRDRGCLPPHSEAREPNAYQASEILTSRQLFSRGCPGSRARVTEISTTGERPGLVRREGSGRVDYNYFPIPPEPAGFQRNTPTRRGRLGEARRAAPACTTRRTR